jgi:hypothetical protein
MTENPAPTKGKKPVKRIVAITVVGIVLVLTFLLYNNFSRLISDALIKSFNSGIASEVYELKFENLSVNPFEGTIRVYNVTLLPREKPEHVYPYINSSFQLKTEKLILRNVELLTLLRLKQLKLKIISITKPEVELTLRGERHIMLPFRDSASLTSPDSTGKTEIFKSFRLEQFHLIEAAVHITNFDKEREFRISNFSISLSNLLINSQPGEYSSSFDRVLLTIGQLSGRMRKGPIQYLEFKAFNVGIDSLRQQLTLDTVMHHFHDFTMGLHKLDVQTADSLFHLTTKSLKISYRDNSIRLKEISFTPNVSHAVLQQDHKFQHTEFSGTVKALELKQVNFDSLIYAKKVFIDEVLLDTVSVSIFKDKTKPLNKDRFPLYLGQTVRKISLPLRINRLKASHVQLDNTERKLDSTLAKVRITRATAEVRNITNLAPGSALTMQADAWLMDKAHFKTTLTFYYSKKQFDFEGKLEKFDLADLTPLIRAYTPAKINQGIADEISFSGVAEETNATGTMKFLYHDLEVDLELKDQARWANSVIAFAANTVLDSSNPGSADLPPRVVKFQIERDMNKGFVNVVIKSLLNGLKETMIMSKENRKAYKEAKQKSRRERKK